MQLAHIWTDKNVLLFIRRDRVEQISKDIHDRNAFFPVCIARINEDESIAHLLFWNAGENSRYKSIVEFPAEVQLIVVIPVYDMYKIEKKIKSTVECDVVALDKVLETVLQKL